MPTQKDIGLPLDSSEWDNLEHAFGECSSTVELLRELKRFATDSSSLDEKSLASRLTDEFSEKLFHQGSYYDATLAAIPHFMQLSSKLPSEMRNEIIYVVAWIHWLRKNNDAPDLEEQQAAWYDAATKIGVQESLNWIHDLAKNPNKDPEEQLWAELRALKTAASFRGETELSEQIHWFEELSFECVSCDELLYARFEYDEYKYSVCRKEDAFSDVRRTLGTQYKEYSGLMPDLKFLLDVAKQGPLPHAEQWACAYFGKAMCPACENETPLRTKLLS